jgi:hypothetical protein
MKKTGHEPRSQIFNALCAQPSPQQRSTAALKVSLPLIALKCVLNRRGKRCIKETSLLGRRSSSSTIFLSIKGSQSNIKMSKSSSHKEPFSAYNMTGSSTKRHVDKVLQKFDSSYQTAGPSGESSSNRAAAGNLSSLKDLSSKRSSEGSRGSSKSSRGYISNATSPSQTSSRGASSRGSSGGRSSCTIDRSSASSTTTSR